MHEGIDCVGCGVPQGRLGTDSVECRLRLDAEDAFTARAERYMLRRLYLADGPVEKLRKGIPPIRSRCVTDGRPHCNVGD